MDEIGELGYGHAENRTADYFASMEAEKFCNETLPLPPA
jgi:hypothetical protein